MKNNKKMIIISCLFGVICSHIPAQAHASYEQWKARQESHDVRLKDNISKGSFQQRVVQVGESTPLAVMTVAKKPQVLGEEFSVNINTAALGELTAKLDGVGRSKAQEIINYRQKNGNFKKPDDLLNVKGIGVKTLEKNRSRIVLR